MQESELAGERRGALNGIIGASRTQAIIQSGQKGNMVQTNNRLH
jgi:hypothetical protein